MAVNSALGWLRARICGGCDFGQMRPVELRLNVDAMITEIPVELRLNINAMITDSA